MAVLHDHSLNSTGDGKQFCLSLKKLTKPQEKLQYFPSFTEAHFSLVTFIMFLLIHAFSTPFCWTAGPHWLWDNHRLPGTAASLHKPLSCKCHSGLGYDLCQLSGSPRREGHGPVVDRRHTNSHWHLRTHTHTFFLSVCVQWCTQTDKRKLTHARSSIHTTDLFQHFDIK